MSLRPGDIVSRRKGPFRHMGIVVGHDQILHNTPLRGEHLSDLNDFSKGKPVRVAHGVSRSLAEATARVHLEAGPRGYNPLTNNCEHTVSRIAEGRAHSPQLKMYAAAIGTSVLAFAVSRNPALARTARLGMRWLAGR
ncbi:MAG: hypothetical protein P8Y95_14525 [Gammaproteobacteria bacterium]|jgi:hypothetical protein